MNWKRKAVDATLRGMIKADAARAFRIGAAPQPTMIESRS